MSKETNETIRDIVLEPLKIIGSICLFLTSCAIDLVNKCGGALASNFSGNKTTGSDLLEGFSDYLYKKSSSIFKSTFFDQALTEVSDFFLSTNPTKAVKPAAKAAPTAAPKMEIAGRNPLELTQPSTTAQKTSAQQLQQTLTQSKALRRHY